MIRRASLPAAVRPAVVGLIATSTLIFAACDEKYHDEAFGVLELEMGGEGRARTASIPTSIDPQKGWEKDQQAEYYDFGPVATFVSGETGFPTAARVNAMYFFFTKDGRPLMAPPLREKRDGTDHIRGGHDVRNINPKDFCAVGGADPVGCTALNTEARKRPYADRFREFVSDPLRDGSRDYQRPLVDVTPSDNGAALYTGLWEVMAVFVPNDYDPDAVKHKKTLDRAVAAGDFKLESTNRVINCPLLDERTDVPPGVTDRATFHPLMEVWYRRKLSFCYLANGWQTLGGDKGNRYTASEVKTMGINTFDISRTSVGSGKAEKQILVVPVGKAYVPNVFFSNNQNGFSETRIGNQVLATGRPGEPGYTPIRWMWDVIVQGEFVRDAFRDESELDADQLFPRSPVVVHNLATRGVAVPCSLPSLLQTVRGREVEQCGVKKTDPQGGLQGIIDASGDPACAKLGLECNKDTCFCDNPPVLFGQRCGFSVARCSEEKDEISEKGYTCFPSRLGFCYVGCDPREKNTLAKQNEGREPQDFVDSRCGSRAGYSCFSVGARGICLKFCDENVLDTETYKQCKANAEVTNPRTNLLETIDLGQGQMCQNFGVQICAWPDDFAGVQ
ncbi:MAG: hypothetical protein SGI86_20145 [Deltaproteobacteria bacterium]|nr:hypothetical protein [Deltaproteobacteria bacterium]